jgi:hypothetical protein
MMTVAMIGFFIAGFGLGLFVAGLPALIRGRRETEVFSFDPRFGHYDEHLVFDVPENTERIIATIKNAQRRNVLR